MGKNKRKKNSSAQRKTPPTLSAPTPRSTDFEPLHEAIEFMSTIFTIVFVFVAGFSVAGLITLFLSTFTPAAFFLIGLLFTVAFFYLVLKKGFLSRLRRTKGKLGWAFILLIVAIAVLGLHLRYPTSAYIHGGQDQGNYFNMAAYYGNHGTFIKKDEILKDSVKEKWMWSELLIFNDLKEEIPGEYEGERAIGCPILSKAEGTIVPQFYHLTSIWMAVSYWIGGLHHSSDILPLFGILSSFGCALLAYSLIRNPLVFLLVHVACCTSSLQVFFGTFPVSAVAHQFFVVSAMLFLAIGFKKEQSSVTILGGIALGLAMFNHLTAIFYLGPLIVALVLVTISPANRGAKLCFHAFYWTALTGAMLSLIPARIYHGYYVYRNFRESLNFMSDWGVNGVFTFLWITVIVALLVSLLLYKIDSSKSRIAGRISSYSLPAIVGVSIVIIGGKYVLHLLGISEADVKYTVISSMNDHLSGPGWVLAAWGLVVAIKKHSNQLSPIVPIVSLAFFSFLFLFLMFDTSYQWYFARYYTKEVHPLMLLFAAIGIAELIGRSNIVLKCVGIAALLFLIGFWAYPNRYIYKKPFLSGAIEHTDKLDELIEEESIVLMVEGSKKYAFNDVYHRLSVALTFGYDHQVIPLPYNKDLFRIIQHISKDIARYERPVYLIFVSEALLPKKSLLPTMKLVQSQLHEFSQPELKNSIPKEQLGIKIPLHLYKVSGE